MSRVLAAGLAELLEFQLIGGLLLVLVSAVILTLALSAVHTNRNAHKMTSLVLLEKASKRREEDQLAPTLFPSTEAGKQITR